MSQSHKHIVTPLYSGQDIFRFIFPGLCSHIASSAKCEDEHGRAEANSTLVRDENMRGCGAPWKDLA